MATAVPPWWHVPVRASGDLARGRRTRWQACIAVIRVDLATRVDFGGARSSLRYQSIPDPKGRRTMRYTLLLHYPEPTAAELGPEALAEGMRAFQRYAKALDDAGVLESAEVLQQSSATTTITLAGGELVVQDGPFADSKEQLGGTFVIDVPDLDAALEWAQQAPSVAWGHVEIRPSATRYVDGSWQGAQPVT
jgi:hypothetical protein